MRVSRQNAKIGPTDFLIVAVSLLSAVYIASSTQSSTFRLFWVLPASFAIGWVLVLRELLSRYAFFGSVFLLVCFVRYVFVPDIQTRLGVYDMNYPGSPTAEDYVTGYGLMVYELLAVCVFLRIYLSVVHRVRSSAPSVEYSWFGSRVGTEALSSQHLNIGYWAFLAGVAAMVIARPSSLTTVSFIVPHFDYGLEQSQMDSLTAYLILIAKNIAFLMLIVHVNSKARSNVATFVSIVATLVSGCIYVGMNRSDFLLSMAASLAVYAAVARRGTKLMVSFAIASAIPITIILGASRDFYVDPSVTGLQNLLNILQAYAGGVYNVAMSVATRAEYPMYANFPTLLIDIFRPMFGVNMLMKNLNLVYSSIPFNWAIYGTDHRAQIIPMVGEGYYTLGAVLSPTLSIGFTYLALKLSRIARSTRQVAVFFFLTITVMRLGFMMGQSASIQVNDLSFNLFLPLLLIWVNERLLFKRADHDVR